MNEMKDIIKRLYIYYFSVKPDRYDINSIMVDLEVLTEFLTEDEREECFNRST